MKFLVLLGLVAVAVAESSRQWGPPPGDRPGQRPPPFGPGGRPGQGPPPFGPGSHHGGPSHSHPGGPGSFPPKPTDPNCPPNDNLQANKNLALRLTKELFGDYSVANIESFMHADFIEHNPLVADGRDALKNFILSLKDEPKVTVEVQRIIADEDFVWIHSKLPLLGKVYAAVDIYRFECGKIKEHWDALQDTALNAAPANSHPFF